jgi:23S rRNA (uracil1939-C5)-methyltransferase
MGKQLKTKIYSLAFGASGVGKVDGKVCFVSGALPDEEVIFEVEKDTSRYTEGRVVEILTSSPARVEPVCRYYNRCGGCFLQHLSYEKELFYKKEQLIQLIRRIAGEKENFECADIVASPDCYHYRASVTLHRIGRKYGYYERNGRTVIEIEECPIAEEAINTVMAALECTGKKEDVTLKSDFDGRVWSSDRPGQRFFVDRYRDVELYMSPKTFSQPNRYMAEKIVETLEEWIGPSWDDAAFFDAYCGVGFFSFLLKQDFCLQVGLDASRIAISCAKNTAKRLGQRNIRFYKGEAEKDFFGIFNRSKKHRNILFIDPPRAGAARSFLEEARNCRDLDRLYYLSCDPARLARDIKILTDGSEWTLRRVCPFDMFPRTKHIETLAEFVKE